MSEEYKFKCPKCKIEVKTNNLKKEKKNKYYKVEDTFPILGERFERYERIREKRFLIKDKVYTKYHPMVKCKIISEKFIEKYHIEKIKCPICKNTIHTNYHLLENFKIKEREKHTLGIREESPRDFHTIPYSGSEPLTIEINKKEYDKLKNKLNKK